jgi:AcrR family transcriptional regulator
MVAALLDAAARTIAKHGLSGATSAKIARAAGVSVGSFYQYFDSKEQLYDALMDRMVDDALVVIEERLRQPQKGDLSDTIRILFDAIWDLLEQNGGVYLEVVRHWTQLNFEHVMDLLERKMFEVLTMQLLSNPRAKSIERVPYKLYILTNATVFTFIRYASQPPKQLERATLSRELADLYGLMLG